MDTAVRIAEVVLGIGFLIFAHETGHFVAARLCGVRVLAFSLGFGPRIAGFVRGGCDYRISLVPVGGYVRMAGEPGDEAFLEGSLSTKPAWQRLFVYAAGVITNVLVAAVLFPVVFAAGVSFTKPVIGSVIPGGAAWKAGLAPGSLVRSIDGDEVYAYEQVFPAVALARGKVRLDLEEPVPDRPGAWRPRVVELLPEYDPSYGFSIIGISPGAPPEDVSDPATGAHAWGREVVVVVEGSPAFEAGVRAGDRLVAVDGEPVVNGLPAASFEHLGSSDAVSMRFVPGPPAGRAADVLARLRAGVSIEARAVPGSSGKPRIGVHPLPAVRALRDCDFARALDLRPGDLLARIDGRPISSVGDLDEALFERSEPSASVEVELYRDGIRRITRATVARSSRGALSACVALHDGGATTRIQVTSGSPAERAGLRAGDRVVRAGGAEVASFADIQKAVAAAGDAPVELEVLRDGEGAEPSAQRIAVKPEPIPERDLGLALRDLAPTVVKASGVGHALRLGLRSTVVSIQQIVVMLKKIAVGEVAAERTLGGPISIARQSFDFAEGGFVKLLFFLAILSLNLALVNLLPIPVLDGGNLLFVIVEKIKGSPVSERVLGASQTVGVFLLIALMVWVTFHDVRNWILG
ncbi:MAG TPA: RIP metalloprotease RseP [Planctomycetota bacterium]|nr:RIP metalloprotease RseP [Planctomycetota bacterium]